MDSSAIGEGIMWIRPWDDVGYTRGRGGAKDVHFKFIQANKSCSPLLFSILHGEGNEKAGEGRVNPTTKSLLWRERISL